MSIFGERIHRPEPDITGVLSDYAKKDYIDAQDGLRVLKAGDTMSGDLTMAQGLVRGLPMNMNKRLEGDEAVSKYQVVEIISEALRHFRARVGPDLSEYAKKDYVDAQDGLRVLKAGDTITGDLTMARGLVRGLPLTQPTGMRAKGDEAISQYQVMEIIRDAFRENDHSRPLPLITVYAEENGSLTKGEYEWSFGNGVAGGNSERGGDLGPTQVYESGYNDNEQPALRGPGRNSHQRSSEPFVRCNQAPGPIL